MKKIPTIIGIILVIVLVGVVAFTSNAVSTITTSLFSRADTSLAPVGDVGVTNITDTSFTVYWQTATDAIGVVYFGQTNQLGDGVAVDDRNLTDPNGKYSTHFVKVPNLKVSTKYYYRVSNATTILQTTTGDKVTIVAETNPIYGKIIDKNGAAIAGAIVVWTSGSSQSLGALSKTDGTFVIPILKNITAGMTESLAVSYNGETNSITCRIGEDRPINDIEIGQSGDCKKTAGTTGTSNFASASTSSTLQINLSEGQQLSPLPTFTGKADISQMVNLVVKTPTDIKGVVKADVNGIWSWSPPSSLSLGSHTITASTSAQQVSRGFVVVSDVPILPVTSGTPSATVEHRACVNSACVLVTGAGSDTCSTDTDCAPIVTPPATPPPQQQYETGMWENTAILLLGGILLSGLGGAFLLF